MTAIAARRASNGPACAWTAADPTGPPALIYACGCPPAAAAPHQPHVAQIRGHADPDGNPYWTIDWLPHAPAHVGEPPSGPAIAYPELQDAVRDAERQVAQATESRAAALSRRRQADAAQRLTVAGFLKSQRPARAA